MRARRISVAPNTLYELHPTHNGHRIYFTQTIREADLWLGRIADREPR